MIGPLKIRNTQGPNQKFEAECHLCKWTFHKWTIDEASEILVWHLDRKHINPPAQYFLTIDEMPGPQHLNANRRYDQLPLYYWRDC
jgi:hypothetical protein